MESSHDAPLKDKKPDGALARNLKKIIAWALARKIVRAALLYTERRGPMLADSITYRALFSVFAGLLLAFSVASIWLADNPAAWEAILATVESAIPGLIGPDGVVKDPTSFEAPAALSVAGIISLVALIGAALGAIGSLRTAVRLIADTVMDDVLWFWVILRNLALALGVGLSFVAAAAVTFAAGVGIGAVTDLLGMSKDSAAATWGVRIVSILIVFALDAGLIAGIYRLLSGRRASARSLWAGALLGGGGLLVLQELSSLFVGGASSNVLLASFASLLALLIWLNLSAQVILLSCAYIVTGVEEQEDRVAAREGARTFAQRRVQRAQKDVVVATNALRSARKAAAAERK